MHLKSTYNILYQEIIALSHYVIINILTVTKFINIRRDVNRINFIIESTVWQNIYKFFSGPRLIGFRFKWLHNVNWKNLVSNSKKSRGKGNKGTVTERTTREHCNSQQNNSSKLRFRSWNHCNIAICEQSRQNTGVLHLEGSRQVITGPAKGSYTTLFDEFKGYGLHAIDFQLNLLFSHSKIIKLEYKTSKNNISLRFHTLIQLWLLHFL